MYQREGDYFLQGKKDIYKLTPHFLGGGSFASTYAAIARSTQEIYAAKVLKPNASIEENRALQSEIHLHQRLLHDHFPYAYDGSTELYRPFLILERARGSVKQRLEMLYPLNVKTVATLTDHVAQGAGYMHDQKFIHRDIAPGNILITPRREPFFLLSDFGFVVPMDENGEYVGSKIQGTLAYLAPEQFDFIASAKSDQYALAAVTHELLNGKKPYQVKEHEKAAQHVAYAASHRHAPIPPLVLDSDVTEELAHVVYKGMAKNPVDRFPDIRAYAQAFGEAQSRGSEQKRRKRRIFDMVFPPIKPTLSLRRRTFFPLQKLKEHQFDTQYAG